MALLNTEQGYGVLTKFFHWLVVALFVFQFAAANIMLRMGDGETALGLSQAAYYNWHKSIGLAALIVAVLRLVARRGGELPPWAPTLSAGERRFGR
jgi:cytochrome b561